MDADEILDASVARRLIDERRHTVAEALAEIERRLVDIRIARAEWTDEEHDPEGFDLVQEWSRLEASRVDRQSELIEHDHADTRVSAGTFGRCESCGRPIAEEQLRHRPARRMCVSCTDRRAGRAHLR